MSAIATYGSFRSKLSYTAFFVTEIAGSTTNAVAGNYNVYLSAENRAGLNQLSDPEEITIAAGQGIEITINSDAIATAEDPFYLVVSVEKSGNPTDAVRLANFKCKENNQVTQRSLPVTIELTTDEHFNLSRIVSTASNLPSSGMVDGAIAFVVETQKYYRYDSEAIIVSGVLHGYNTPTEGYGNWIRHYRTFSSYVENTLIQCDTPIDLISNAIAIPVKKIADIDSTPIIYWLNNGFSNDGRSPIINGCYTFKIEIDGDDYTGVFAERIKYQLLGYCDRTTGILDINIDTVGDLKTWSPTNPVKLPADLPRNWAAVYKVYLSYAAEDISQFLPDNYNYFNLNFFEYGNNTGYLDSSANGFGDLVFSDLDKLLIVPGTFRLSGIATKKIPGSTGFRIEAADEQPIVGLLPDTPNQIAAMAASTNGTVVIRQQGESLAYSEVIRAYISTEIGLSDLSLVSSEFVANSNGIRVTVTHPVNSNGNGIVRSNYSDQYLAGNSLGSFTATEGYLFLDINGVFYQSSLQSVLATSIQPEQEFDFVNLSSFSAIPGLPIQSDPAFSLFEPLAIAIAGNGSGSITGTIKAYWAYSYESPNYKPTKIRHDLAGTIPTLEFPIGEMLGDLSSYRAHLDDLYNPHQVTRSQIGAASEAEFSSHKNNYSNPHQVTLTALGGMTATKIETLGTKVKTVTANYTTVSSDNKTVITVDSSTNVTITLSTPSSTVLSALVGKFELILRKVNLGNITIAVPNGIFLEGSGNKLEQAYQSVYFCFDNNKWIAIGNLVN